MNTEFVKDLADVISTNTKEDIYRELRVVSMMHKTGAQEQIAIKKQLLSIALEFIKNQPQLPKQWRNSYDCYSNLTDWFENAEQIENHKTLSALSWSMQLKTQFPDGLNLRRLIILGKSLYGDPCKFVGFLFFLIENGVHPDDILAKGVLHRFFSYHSYQVSEIQNAYAVLSGLSERAKSFVVGLTNIHCNERGLINAAHYPKRFMRTSKKENPNSLQAYLLHLNRLSLFVNRGKRRSSQRYADRSMPKQKGYFSRNIIGGFFHHSDKLSIIERNYEEVLLNDDLPVGAGALYFRLFGWDFISLLSSEESDISNVIKSIISSSTMKDQLLMGFVQNALMGVLSKNVINLFLQEVIKFEYDDLRTLILKEPFYVHAIKFGYSRTLLSSAEINRSAQLMSDNDRYLTINHIPYLAGLISNPALTAKTPLLEAILKTMLEHQKILSAEAVRAIQSIDNYAAPHVTSKLDDFLSELNDAQAQFICGNIDYHTIESEWGNKLAWVNLFRWFYPHVIRYHYYPTTIYNMRSHSLSSCYDHAQEHKYNFDLAYYINKISDDKSVVTRTLQEAMIGNEISMRLIDFILQYIATQGSVSEFLMMTFGEGISVLYYAFTHSRPFLRQAILNHMTLADDHVNSLVYLSATRKKIHELNYLFKIFTLTPSVIVNSIETIFNVLLVNGVSSHRDYDILEQLTALVFKLNDVRLSTSLIVEMFHKSIDFDYIYLAETILCLKDQNQLPLEAFESGVEKALSVNSQEFLALFFGLRGSKNMNSNLVTLNNVIGFMKKVKDVDFQTKNPLLWKKDDGDTLLHIAANHCSLNDFIQCVEIFECEIESELRALLITKNLTGCEPVCYEDNPDKVQINERIAALRLNYGIQQEYDLLSQNYTLRRHERDSDDSYMQWRSAEVVNSEDSGDDENTQFRM